MKQSVEFSQVPLLDQFLTYPLLCHMHSTRVKVVDISVVAQMQIPFTIEILQLQFIDKVVDVRCAVPAVSGAVVDETAELPHLQLVSHGHCRCHARRCATTAAVFFRSENCEGPSVAVH